MDFIKEKLKSINLNTMKKVLLTIIGATLLTSCGKSDPISLNNPESITKIEELVKSSFGEDKDIHSLTIDTKDHLTSEVEDIEIGYLDNGLDYRRSYNFTNEEGKELAEPTKVRDNFQTKFFLRDKQGKIKIKDLDFKLITAKLDEAVKIIPEEYENFTLHSWEYIVTNDGGLTAEFTIEATKEGEGTSVQGRNIVTNYYEFPFKMNAKKEIEFDGN